MVARSLKLMVLASLCLYANFLCAESYIKLQLDSSEVYAGDTVVLDMESTGLLDPIDLSLLEEQADLLRETRGTRIAVIGGKVVEIAIRRMDIVPKKSGVMVIGPLSAGDVVSNSVHLKVLDSVRPNWTPAPNDLKTQVTLTPSDAKVNQKVLLTIELQHRYPISNESITLPSLNGFAKRTLIENKRTFSGDNREWFKTEWQYLIFPKQSGVIDIDPIEWSGTLAKSRIEKAGFQRQTEITPVSVRSKPAGITDWWLPASNITLTEAWSTPPTELRAGDELERTITVSARDVLSGQIPALAVPESRAIKQTLINTQRSEQLTASGVISTAEFTYRVKAQSPIPVFLDTVRLPWWNTRSDEPKEAIIPARRINVGLPDRADVLSKIALQETGANRIIHWLQSAGGFRIAAMFIGLCSAIVLLWTLLPVACKSVRCRTREQRHRKHLRSLAKSGDAAGLYRALNTPGSRKLLHHSKLRRTLESRLFSTNADNSDVPLDKLPLDKLLKDAIRSQHSVRRPDSLQRRLASL